MMVGWLTRARGEGVGEGRVSFLLWTDTHLNAPGFQAVCFAKIAGDRDRQ